MAESTAPPTTSAAFVWVHSTEPHVPDDRNTRTNIRRQAMRDIAAERRRTGQHRNRNVRQLPVFVGPVASPTGPQAPEQAQDVPEETEIPQGEGQAEIEGMAVGPQMPPPAGFRRDFYDLSYLTSVEVGRVSGRLLLDNPRMTIMLFGRKHGAWLSLLPTLYGQDAALTDAADALFAKVQCHVLSWSSGTLSGRSLALSSYAKALRSLQSALENIAQRFKPEVLCAMETLAFYELLNPDRENAFTRHAAGAASLIRLRGPRNFNSDIERSTLLSHTGSIIAASNLNNEPCFLEQPDWHQCLLNTITDDVEMPERSETVITLMLHMTLIPRLFRDVTSAICHAASPSTADVDALRARARHIRDELHAWRRRNYDDGGNLREGTAVTDGYCRTHVYYHACIVLANRMLTAVTWGEGPEIEEETQEAANTLVALFAEKAYVNLQGAMLMQQKVKMARATISTAADWRVQGGEVTGEGVIERRKFERWCGLFGRKTE